MAYKKTKWVDHVVERPNTYKEVDNGDGTVTHHEASGEVIQQGTPVSATNLNNIETYMQHMSIAMDWMQCIMQATQRALEDVTTDLTEATAAMTT